MAHRREWIVLAVAIGGALGTVVRYEVAQAMPVAAGHFPWATLVVNLVGSFVLGAGVVALADLRPATELGRAFLAVGFCGGLTTFSTWMVGSVLLVRDGDVGVAVLDVVVSLVAGLVVLVAGALGARLVFRRPVPAFDPELDD